MIYTIIVSHISVKAQFSYNSVFHMHLSKTFLSQFQISLLLLVQLGPQYHPKRSTYFLPWGPKRSLLNVNNCHGGEMCTFD